MRRAALFALAALASSVIGIGWASAQSIPDGTARTWGVAPAAVDGATTRSALTFTAKPGAVVSDAVTITNFGTTPLTLAVYAADAFNTPTGGYDVATSTTANQDVGAWTVVSQPTVTLDPSASTTVLFTLTVPTDAEPGDHAGGILASLSGSAADAAGNPIQLNQRVGARIYLRVDGPLRPALTVESFKVQHSTSLNPFGGGKTTIRYTVRNTGNVRMSASQVASVDGPFGLFGRTKRLDALPELLPGSGIEQTATIKGSPAAFRLNAKLTLTPVKGSATLNKSAARWAIPWTLFAALAVLALGFRGGRRLRSRGGRPRTAYG